MTANNPTQSLNRLKGHPLNQAAMLVLKKAGTPPKELPFGLMPVLVLATTQLAEANELDDRLPLLAAWAGDNQAKALALLEKHLEVDELVGATMQDAAALIADVLAPIPASSLV